MRSFLLAQSCVGFHLEATMTCGCKDGRVGIQWILGSWSRALWQLCPRCLDGIDAMACSPSSLAGGQRRMWSVYMGHLLILNSQWVFAVSFLTILRTNSMQLWRFANRAALRPGRGCSKLISLGFTMLCCGRFCGTSSPRHGITRSSTSKPI